MLPLLFVYLVQQLYIIVVCKQDVLRDENTEPGGVPTSDAGKGIRGWVRRLLARRN
jgi:hypothetical protein